MPQQPRRWTEEEDKLLQREVQAQLRDGQVKDWRCIAERLPGRTNKDCRKRWHNAIAGGPKKGHWTQDEDRALVDAVKTYGETWTTVASAVSTRNAEQCAKRWNQCLDPGLNRSQWTEMEDRRLLEAYSKHGRHWKEIQVEYFPNRSQNMIRNQFTIISRRLAQSAQKGPSRIAKKSLTSLVKPGEQNGTETEDEDEDDDTGMPYSACSSDVGKNMEDEPLLLSNMSTTTHPSSIATDIDNVANITAPTGSMLPGFSSSMDYSSMEDFLPGLPDGGDLSLEGMLNTDPFPDAEEFIPVMPSPSYYNRETLDATLRFAPPSMMSSSVQDFPAGGARSASEVEIIQGTTGRITLTVYDPSHETTASLIQIAVANNTRFRVERD